MNIIKNREIKGVYIFTLLVSFLIYAVLFNTGFVLAELNVPLKVSDYAGMSRSAEPVTTGVPLPQDANIKSISQLQITDSSGSDIPAQFTVLSRWNGTPNDTTKPIKWVLLDFQANVPANGTSVYYLTDGGAGNASSSSLTISQDDDKIVVNTGAARFQISKHYFNLFDYVWVDSDNDGAVDDPVVSSVGSGGLVLKDATGKEYRTIYEAPEEIKIEEQGPMRTVINIRGVFKASDGTYFAPSICHSGEYPKFCQPYPHSYVYYNCRIYFYNDKDYVRIFLTLENNGANGRTNPEQYYAPNQTVYFDSVNLLIHPYISDTLNVAAEGGSATVQGNESFELYQDWKENLTDSVPDTLEPKFADGPFYKLTKCGQQIASGKTNPGWIQLANGNKGIGLAIRYFWQNFPKKITVSPSQIKIGLWPEGGYYPYTEEARNAGTYLFDAGRHKTYEMLISFSGSGETGRYLSASVKNPLMALAPSEWYASTKALGMIAPYGLTSPDPIINEAMQRFERLQSAMVREKDSDNGWTIFNIKTKNPPHWELAKQNRFFNWMNFGDLLWGSQAPCNLHYDWTYSMLLHFIRTGEKEFFEAGSEMARYRYDIGQYHGERTSTSGSHKWVNHFQFYESSGHADPAIKSYHPSKVSLPTHTWNGGLVLYYLITGDKKAWEAAEENGKAVLNYYGPGGLRDASTQKCPRDEIRYEGWSILNLLNLFRVSGDSEYLEVAKNIAKNRLLYREQQVGSGYWGGDASSGSLVHKLKPIEPVKGGCGAATNTQWSTFYAYIIEPIISITSETDDSELKALIVRMADFLKNKFLFGGDYDTSGKYRPIQSLYLWAEEDPEGAVRNMKGEIVKDVFWPDLFAYAYLLTNNAEYLDWARKSFKDGMFYYAKTGSQYLDPNTRSTISFIDGQFPNSHTKAHGWIGRTNQVYLYTEWQLQQGELKIVTSSLPTGTVGAAYSYPISVAGGKAPYDFSVQGTLPTGLTMNSSGVIGGIPSESGTFSFTVYVADSASKTVSKNYSIMIQEPSSGEEGGGSEPSQPGLPPAPSRLRIIQ